MMKKTILSIILLALFSLPVSAAPFVDDSFDSYADLTAVLAVWGGSPTRVTLESGANAYGGSGKCLRWAYASGGTTDDYQVTRSVISQNLDDIYVQMRFKVCRNTGGSPVSACKFLKLFGYGYGDEPATYSNCTLNLGDNGNFPVLQHVYYGNGDGTTNDTQCAVFFTSGSHTDECDTALITYDAQNGVFTPTENTWYTMELHAKKNANGSRDGVFEVWIDGTKYLGVTNVKNNSIQTSELWDFITLGDYASASADMLLYVDDVVISDAPIGSSGTAPAPPTLSNVTISNGSFR